MSRPSGTSLREAPRRKRSDGRGVCNMEEDEFTHPGLRMIREPRAFTVVLPVKSDRFRRLLHLVWFVVWLAGEAALILGLRGMLPVPALPQQVLLTFLAAFTAAGVFVLYRLLWYMGGRGRQVVRGGRLGVRKEIWGLGRRRGLGRSSWRGMRGGRL